VLLPIVPAGLPIIVSVFGVAISLIMVRVPGEPRTRRSESASDGEQS